MDGSGREVERDRGDGRGVGHRWGRETRLRCSGVTLRKIESLGAVRSKIIALIIKVIK